MKRIENLFVVGVSDLLEQKFFLISRSIFALNMSIQKLRNTQETEHMTKEWVPEIQARFIEAILEIVTYQLNPKKGRKPVDLKTFANDEGRL